MSILRTWMDKLSGQAAPSRPPMRVFVLDDDPERLEWFERRFRHDEVDTAQDAVTAIEMLDNNRYDAIFLDHDLLPEHYGAKEWDDERTGYAVACALAGEVRQQRSATIIIHSLNTDGAVRMAEKLREAGYAADYIPFPMLEHRLRKYWP
jgi:DNA-binding response OmpR family regulator